MSTSPVLLAEGVSRAYDGRPVLTDLSLRVDPGHRVGLVGENGAGKSTLLRVLAGVEEPDSGHIARPPDLGFLSQELDLPPATTVDEVIDDALAAVQAIEQELEAAAAGLAAGDDRAAQDRYDRALQRAELAQVWDAPMRVARTLAGLGLAAVGHDRRLGELSGGQRRRLALAALLVRQPAALLLDEPTNDLDDAGCEFVAGVLRTLPGGVLFASHDRVFLDEVATEILDLDPQMTPHGAGVEGARGVSYGGGYSDYRTAKRTAREQWERRYEQEQDELKALRADLRTTARAVGHDREIRDNNTMAFGRRGDRVESQVSRRVRNVQTRHAELERTQVRRPPRELRFAPPPGHGTGRVGAPAIRVRDAVVADRLDLPGAGHRAIDLQTDGRLLVTGANGAGKSTLLALLAGDLEPDSGTVQRAKGLEVALLEQDLQLAGDARTPRELLELMAPGRGDDASGLLSPRDLGRPLADLSVGQRRRVVLAMLMLRTPDVLLLDEPTNHFSLTLAEELLRALDDWPGAVVVASHDRWLRREWTGETLDLALPFSHEDSRRRE